ncbi:MAG: TSUP family transporter [Oscillospiraceae bacterium]|nr:TSUP family transporter [Oscillospiraceae bacterium]
MKNRNVLSACICGAVAGVVNGLLGTGGGMVLLPLLERYCDLEEKEVFACCVGIILPLSTVSLGAYFLCGGSIEGEGFTYILGGVAGGVLGGLLLKKLRCRWLHRIMGAFILWGAWRLLVL